MKLFNFDFNLNLFKKKSDEPDYSYITQKNPHYKDGTTDRPVYPARTIVLSFLAVILIGTFLLCMPFSSASGRFTDPLTSLFTATTSTCVTGLVLVDTGSYWSAIGQFIILSLIQIGGLGLVTLTTFFVVIFRQKIGLGNLSLAQSSTGSQSIQNLRSLVKLIVISTLTIEFAGAMLLSIRFIPQMGVNRGLWVSIFTAISAYCNAGIDIFDGEFTSATAYISDPLVNGVIMGLIILGGLGFLVFQDIIMYRRRKKMMLHSKIVLLYTFVLITAGAIIYFLFEYSNPKTLSQLNTFDKIMAAFFQSVTTRTAGFNTVDFGSMYDPTKLVSCLLMFIGACPGSTGGGIKVTTFIVIVMTVVAAFCNRRDTVILKRKVDYGVVYKSLALVAVGIMVCIFTSAVIIIECKNVSTIDAIFEAVSAFGTAGLTAGATPHLGFFSKVAVILTMFIGRVGSFSIFMAMTLKENEKGDHKILPNGEIMVG